MLKLILFLCGFVTSVAYAEITVSNATVRLLPPGVPNTAAYFSIQNDSDKKQILIGASAEFVTKAEIHNHIMVNDMMSMEKQSEVVIRPGEKVQFSPGGLHVMLFGLKQTLHEGQSVTITLLTKEGESINIKAIVTQPSVHQHH